MANDDMLVIKKAEPMPANDDGTVDVSAARTDLEHVRVEVEYDLVPDWSNALQRMCAFFGEAVAVGVEGDKFVVKAAIAPEKKDELMATIQRHWAEFARRRKQEGRWRDRT